MDRKRLLRTFDAVTRPDKEVLRMLGWGAWKKRQMLETGGWFDMTTSEEIAHGYGYFLWKTQAGAYVIQDAPYHGNFHNYEVSEEEAFQSLIRNGKQRVAKRYFPERYRAWVETAQR